MSEYRPVTTFEDLSTLDHNEMLAGYHYGRHGGPEPYNVTRSFWHGWRNGSVDGGYRLLDQHQRQLGDADKAAALRNAARSGSLVSDKPFRLFDPEFIAWRGYVWAKVRVRKGATCAVMGVPIPAGGWAWRQLSEVKDRDLRVAAGVWAAL